MPEGFLSDHLVNGLEPGTIIRLAAPNGDFVLPEPPPAKILFLVAGSGITPVMAMLRTLHRRGTMPDVLMAYSSPTKERMIFRDQLVELGEEHDGLRLHEQHTDSDGILEMDDLDRRPSRASRRACASLSPRSPRGPRLPPRAGALTPPDRLGPAQRSPTRGGRPCRRLRARRRPGHQDDGPRARDR